MLKQNLRKVQAEGPGKVWSGGLPGAELTVALESALSHHPAMPQSLNFQRWFSTGAHFHSHQQTADWGQKGAHFPQNKDFIYE